MAKRLCLQLNIEYKLLSAFIGLCGLCVLLTSSDVCAEQERSSTHKKEKISCACAVPRLVHRGMPHGALSLSERAIPVWLDSTGERQLGAFADDKKTLLWLAKNPKGTEFNFLNADKGSALDVRLQFPKEAIALGLASFSLEKYGKAQHDQALLRLVQVEKPSAVPSSFFIAMKKVKSKQLLDRWKIQEGVEIKNDKPRGSPQINALFLGPYEDKIRPGCGKSVSHLAWPMEDLSAPSAIAWVVEGWTDNEADRKVALVDHRHLVTFGIGHVEACKQGLVLDENKPMNIRLRPISADLSVGEPWTFKTPGRPSAIQVKEARSWAEEAAKDMSYTAARGQRFLPMPELIDAPDNYKSWLKNPFLEGFAPKTLSHEKDAIAVGTMVLMFLAAVMIAWLLRVFKKKKPFYADVECVLCKDVRNVDLNDENVDGSSCPKCGKSVLYVSTGASGPLPYVQNLEPTLKK